MELDKYNLKDEEKKKIEEILKKAEKRPRKKIYTLKWIYNYLDEGFKDFSYEEFNDVIDMIETLFELGKKAGVSNNRLKQDVIYHLIEERYLEDLETSEDKEIKRLNCLMKNWKFNKNEIQKINKERMGGYEEDGEE